MSSPESHCRVPQKDIAGEVALRRKLGHGDQRPIARTAIERADAEIQPKPLAGYCDDTLVLSFGGMPIYEYKCGSCGHEFEELVRVGQTAPCPSCGNPEPERRLSMCAISTAQTRKLATESGRKIASRTRRDKQAADAEYIRKHTEDHH